MNKLIEIPDKTLDKLKKKALKNNSRSVKKYIEDILIDHANKGGELRIHFGGETSILKTKS